MPALRFWGLGKLITHFMTVLQLRFQLGSMCMVATSFNVPVLHGFRVRLAVLAAIAATAVWEAPVSARVITCSFTEPFVRTFYDSAHKTLKIVHDVVRAGQVQNGVTAKKISKTILELRNRKGEIVQRLEHSFQGSDGMSDTSYPYAVQWIPRDPSMPELLNGGCK
jgi:hypothetical protein